MCTTCQLNQEAAEKDVFTGRLLEIFNGGALALMISIGHRTGLFDTMAQLPPATSASIARAADLDERYVREWLGALVAGKIIHCDEEGRLFHLPTSYVEVLSTEHGMESLSHLGQFIGLLGTVEDDIVECFRRGGGVAYEKFGRFHDIMAEDSGMSVVAGLIDFLIPNLIPEYREQLESGIFVADLGCGQGRALNLLARTFPNSEFLGYDLSETALKTARKEAADYKLANVRFHQKDLTTWDAEAPSEAFDLVFTFDAVHDQPRPDNLLKGIKKCLRPDGLYLMQDIKGSSNPYNNRDHLIGPLLYTISCMHCMTVSLAQDGMGLGAMWGKERALEMLAEAGFTQVDVRDFDFDPQNYWYVVHH